LRTPALQVFVTVQLTRRSVEINKKADRTITRRLREWSLITLMKVKLWYIFYVPLVAVLGLILVMFSKHDSQKIAFVNSYMSSLPVSDGVAANSSYQVFFSSYDYC
jgi:hypothetical protein